MYLCKHVWALYLFCSTSFSFDAMPAQEDKEKKTSRLLLPKKCNADVTLEGVEFLVGVQPRTFAEAVSFCAENGKRPITIRNSQEQIRLKEVTRLLGVRDDKQCWLGITDSKYEGTWLYYFDETLITFKMWEAGRPLNVEMGRNRDCAVSKFDEIAYNVYMGAWIDVSCEAMNTALCQSTPPQSTTTPNPVSTASNTETPTTSEYFTSKEASTSQSSSHQSTEATSTIVQATTLEAVEVLQEIEDQLAMNMSLAESTVNKITNEVAFLSDAKREMENDTNINRIVSILLTVSATANVSASSFGNVVRAVNNIHNANSYRADRMATRSKEDVVSALTNFASNVEIPSNQSSLVTTSKSVVVQVNRINNRERVVEFNSSSIVGGEDDGDLVLVRLPIAPEPEPGSPGGNRPDKLRVTFIGYEDDVFFPSEFLVEKVVTVSVSGVDLTEVLRQHPVEYSTPLRDANSSREYRFLSCAFWNFTQSAWSNKGCSYVVGSHPPKCQCNHLSNFALIVRLAYIPPNLGLNLIGYIGCSLSVLGFFATSFIYVYFRKLRRSKPGPIHIHLCICLGVSYLVFLIGADNVHVAFACYAFAAAVHYFLLAAWLWMFVEGVAMYKNLVVKFGSLGEHFLLKSALACYLIPALTVAVTVGVTIGIIDAQSPWYRDPDSSAAVESSYVHESFCWLHGYTLIGAFLSQIGVIFVANCIVYGIVVRSITCAQQMIKSNKSKASAKEHVIKATAVSALLGLTWIFSLPLFLSEDPVLVTAFSYVFSIFNSLQGVVIFFLFCARNKATRDLWWKPIWTVLRRAKPRRSSSYDVNSDLPP